MGTKMKPFTLWHKILAIEVKYYQHQKWEPKVGDYYTICRNDLKLFQIVKEENGDFYFACNEYDTLGNFPVDGFADKDFGLNRVWVPDWVLSLEPPVSPLPKLILALQKISTHNNSDPDFTIDTAAGIAINALKELVNAS